MTGTNPRPTTTSHFRKPDERRTHRATQQVETTPKKQNLADLTVLAYGRSKIGKCLRGDTQLIDAHSGRPVSLRDLVATGAGDVLTKLAFLPYGLFLVSHSVER